MNDRLAAKQAQLALIIQDLSANEISNMLWNLGFSGSRLGRKEDVDASMRKAIQSFLDPANPADIPQEVIARAHDIALARIRRAIGENMTFAAEAVVARAYTNTRRLKRNWADAILPDKP